MIAPVPDNSRGFERVHGRAKLGVRRVVWILTIESRKSAAETDKVDTAAIPQQRLSNVERYDMAMRTLSTKSIDTPHENDAANKNNAANENNSAQ